MGAQPSNTSSLFTEDFLRKLQRSTALNLSHEVPYQIHEILSHSREHHEHILHQIRAKKNYNSPYIIKIIDSHTVQSHSFCSNMIKTFVMVEKPDSLQIIIEKGKQYFSEQELWLILYSCCSGIQFLMSQGICLTRITKDKIFIDPEGSVKICDPQLSESLISGIGASERQILNDMGEIIKEIGHKNYSEYSNSLKTGMKNCIEGKTSLDQIISTFNSEVSQSSRNSSPSFSLNSFNINPKINLTHKSSKSTTNAVKKEEAQLQCRLNTSYSYKSQYSHKNSKSFKSTKVERSSPDKTLQDKENSPFLTNHDQLTHTPNDLALFTFKDPLKQLSNEQQRDEINHWFPKKALFKQKNKKEKCCKEGEESQKEHLRSFQVDKETVVCEVEKDKSSYIWELLNTKRMSEISMTEKENIG